MGELFKKTIKANGFACKKQPMPSSPVIHQLSANHYVYIILDKKEGFAQSLNPLSVALKSIKMENTFRFANNSGEINMNDLTMSSLGAGCLILENNKVLLVKLNYGPAKGAWILPGGMVEKNEAPHEAALRELHEETGLQGKVLIKVSSRHRTDSKNRTNIYWVFLCQITSDKDTPLIWPKEEIQEVKYWDVEEAMNSPEVRPMTQLYIKQGLGLNQEDIIIDKNDNRTDTIYF